MPDPFDFSEPQPQRPPRRDDRDHDDSPRRRPRYDDDDDYDRRPRRRPTREAEIDREWERQRPQPQDARRDVREPKSLPGSIVFAGIVWLIFGALELIVGAIAAVFAILAAIASTQVGNKQAAQDVIVQLGITSVVLIGAGLLFLFFAIGVLRARAGDVVGQAITSFVFAGLFMVAMCFNIVRVQGIDDRGAAARQVRTIVIATTVTSLLFGAMLGGSGLAALIGRGDYQKWVTRGRRASQLPSNTMTGDDFASSFG